MIVPFVLQILGAAGLVGYLSFRNGQKAVNDLSTQLRLEITSHVSTHLDAYLGTPRQLNEINRKAVKLGLLDLNDFETLGQYFWKQMQVFDIGYINYANEQSEFIGVERLDDGTFVINEILSSDVLKQLRIYQADDQGNRTQIKTIEDNTNIRTEGWYKAIAITKQSQWSQIYQWQDKPDVLSLSLSYPVLDNNRRLQGVLGVDIILSQLNVFLDKLEVSPSSHSFILERNGFIVANSGKAKVYRMRDGQPQRIQAINSNNDAIRDTAQYLMKYFGTLSSIQESYLLSFKRDGERQFVQVTPWQDKLGLNWLIVVVVPESDFMAQINSNTRTTLILCGLAVSVAIVIGVLTARWIVEPILRLNFAATDLAQGQWNKRVDINRSDEVGQLATTFNYMADKLKQSFDTLENQKNAFARFFPSAYLQFFGKNSVTAIELGDHASKEMAVMFSDIRSFTELSAKMTPRENFDFINAYLRRVSPPFVVIMALSSSLWGCGHGRFPEGADDALQASIAQIKALHKYNIERNRIGHKPIRVGFGIHIGPMMVGIVGEHNRIQGDALSGIVTLTSRLEGLTKYYGVWLLVAEEVLQKSQNPEQYQVRCLGQAIVKGNTDPLRIYEVLDAELPVIRELKLQTLSIFEQGINSYCQGDLADAKSYFSQVLRVNAQDRAAQFYLEQIEELMMQGIPEKWEGCWTFTHK